LSGLLSESLGGRAKTLILATISPSKSSLEETLKTLEYAHRAKSVENRPEINQKVTHKQYVRDLQVSIAQYKKQIEAMRTKTGVFLPPDQYDDMKQKIEKYEESGSRLQETLIECEAELETTRKHNSILKQDLAEAQSRARAIEDRLVSLFERREADLHQSVEQSRSALKESVQMNDTLFGCLGMGRFV
jgi:kinesin family member 11